MWRSPLRKAVDEIADMMSKRLAHNDTRFDAIESRRGKIEILLIEEQNRKIENLERRMKSLT
jgi:hypothetical protein